MSHKYITLKLKNRTALHLGSGKENETSDALLRRDSQGNLILPGTSIAGALRTLLTRLAPRLGLDDKVCQAIINQNSSQACGCLVCGLFGDINPRDGVGNQAEASRLLVRDGQSIEPLNSAVRDGVGIQRSAGAAARSGGAKFDLEVLPPDAVFDLLLELRNSTPEQEKLLAVGLAEWKAGRGWLGGRVSRGLGAFQLIEIKSATQDFTDSKILIDYLMADDPSEVASAEIDWQPDQLETIQPVPAQEEYLASRWVEITGVLHADGPLLTNDTASADLSGFDHAPLVAGILDWGTPLLSGAGIRGVIRSHAERLARTLASAEAQKNVFLEICPACDPNESRANVPLTSCDKLLRDAQFLSENDEVGDEHLCLACRLFGSTRRGSRLIVEDAFYYPDAAHGAPKYKMLDFLAVDRFTGGSANHLKFDALALWNPAFSLRIFLENPSSWELGWLMLVLRDMQSGWLHMGMGAAKGFGKVYLMGLKLNLGYLIDEDIADLNLVDNGKRNGSIFKEISVPLEEAAPWIADFLAMEVRRNRSAQKLPELSKDTYFGEVDRLYLQKVME